MNLNPSAYVVRSWLYTVAAAGALVGYWLGVDDLTPAVVIGLLILSRLEGIHLDVLKGRLR